MTSNMCCMEVQELYTYICEGLWSRFKWLVVQQSCGISDKQILVLGSIQRHRPSWVRNIQLHQRREITMYHMPATQTLSQAFKGIINQTFCLILHPRTQCACNTGSKTLQAGIKTWQMRQIASHTCKCKTKHIRGGGKLQVEAPCISYLRTKTDECREPLFGYSSHTARPGTSVFPFSIWWKSSATKPWAGMLVSMSWYNVARLTSCWNGRISGGRGISDVTRVGTAQWFWPEKMWKSHWKVQSI